MYTKEQKKAYMKAWRFANAAKVKEYEHNYELTHKEDRRKRNESYYERTQDKIRAKRNMRDKQKKQTDPSYRLRTIISSIIAGALKHHGSSKGGRSCSKYLPYSMNELKDHLEQQFEPWMNWNNQGRYSAKSWDDTDPSTWTWQVDHIIPRSSLPYSSMDDENFQKCWSLDNLRPYSAKQNLLDGVNKTRHL